MQDITNHKKGLSEKEAAVRWPYSVAWFRRKRIEGGGPPYMKVGGRVIYLIDNLDEWFEAHSIITSTSEVSSHAD
jgi:hypothetical protein